MCAEFKHYNPMALMFNTGYMLQPRSKPYERNSCNCTPPCIVLNNGKLKVYLLIKGNIVKQTCSLTFSQIFFIAFTIFSKLFSFDDNRLIPQLCSFCFNSSNIKVLTFTVRSRHFSKGKPDHFFDIFQIYD